MKMFMDTSVDAMIAGKCEACLLSYCVLKAVSGEGASFKGVWGLNLLALKISSSCRANKCTAGLV